MNEDLSSNFDKRNIREKKLIIISLSPSCILLFAFIIAIGVTVYHSKTYVKKLYDKSLQSVVEAKAYTKGCR